MEATLGVDWPKPPRRRVAVLGNGGFGTALALHALALDHAVSLWGHDPDYTARMAATRRNPRYLPEVRLPDGLRIESSPAILTGAELLLSVVPTQHLRVVLGQVRSAVPPGIPILSCSKGIEQDGGQRPSQCIAEVMPGHPVYVLSGPCHAEELARGLPASQVVAGPDGPELILLQEALSSPALRLYRGRDPLGVELGGALKNPIAIAAGIADGLGLGDNAKSALLTRGLAEMARFGEACGAQRETFMGLAGLGDLITTSFSPHGRNRALGERLGRGETLVEILATTKKVSEGVWTTRAVLTRARKLEVEMPIHEEVALVLFDDKPAAQAARELMTRLLKEEN